VLHLKFAREAAGAAGTRLSLRPLFFWAKDSSTTRAYRAGSRTRTFNWRVWKGKGVPNVHIAAPFRHFPLSGKRFMVPRGFAIGKL
jgi:hypothetical protein